MTFSITKGLLPPEVTALFGYVKTSFGHVKRLCKILRSELRRQVLILYDWLRALCFIRGPEWMASRNLQFYSRLAAETTEFWWSQSGAGSLKVIGDAHVPEGIAGLLQKGPRYSVEKRIPAYELLALNRRVDKKDEEDVGERCLLDRMDSLLRSVPSATPHRHELEDVASHFKNNT